MRSWGAALIPPLRARPFDQEFILAVRAGRDQLSDDERQALLKENHPLLAQIGDQNTVKLPKFFAQLPDESHDQLKTDSYLKWNFTDLDEHHQQVIRELLQLNIDMAAQQGGPAQPGFSIEALERSQVGFATVEIAATNQKVLSWFVLWPEVPSPTWVTVVNARAAGSQPCFQAHLQRLPLLKTYEGKRCAKGSITRRRTGAGNSLLNDST